MTQQRAKTRGNQSQASEDQTVVPISSEVAIVPPAAPAIAARIAPVIQRIRDPRRRAFVDRFLACNVGADAARAAGYSEKSAKGAAYRLLKEKEIQEVIAECRRIMAQNCGYNVEAAMAEFEEAIAFAKATKNATAYVRALELKAKLSGLLDKPEQQQSSSLYIVIHDGPDEPAPPRREIEVKPEEPPVVFEETTSPPPGAYAFSNLFPDLSKGQR